MTASTLTPNVENVVIVALLSLMLGALLLPPLGCDPGPPHNQLTELLTGKNTCQVQSWGVAVGRQAEQAEAILSHRHLVTLPRRQAKTSVCEQCEWLFTQ